MGTSFFLEVKQEGHKVNHPLPSSAKVKNMYSHTSTPPMCLLGIEKDNCTFLSFVNWMTRYSDSKCILIKSCISLSQKWVKKSENTKFHTSYIFWMIKKPTCSLISRAKFKYQTLWMNIKVLILGKSKILLLIIDVQEFLWNLFL